MLSRKWAGAARFGAALAMLAAALPIALPAAADGGATKGGAALHCTFDTQGPAPGTTVDRRFVDIVVIGKCNRRVRRLPQAFLDGRELEGVGETRVPFRFSGRFAGINLDVGPHDVQVIVQPQDPGVQPFVANWRFFAR